MTEYEVHGDDERDPLHDEVQYRRDSLRLLSMIRRDLRELRAAQGAPPVWIRRYWRELAFGGLLLLNVMGEEGRQLALRFLAPAASSVVSPASSPPSAAPTPPSETP